jgi:hypothetical protein
MKLNPATLALAPLLALALALGGCAATPEAQGPEVRELRRADAIATAQRDATRRFGDGYSSRVEAQYSGGFWVVDLRTADGAGLHYAISARDGSIRERDMRP